MSLKVVRHVVAECNHTVKAIKYSLEKILFHSYMIQETIHHAWQH